MPKVPSDRSSWNLKDVVDFEYQRRLDHSVNEGELEQRDREIFRKNCNNCKEQRTLLRCWLEALREQRLIKPEPGVLFIRCYQWLSFTLVCFAIFSGISATWLALKYDGSVPVNVSVFLGLIVAPQMLLLLGYLLVILGSLMRASWIAMLYALPTKVATVLLKMIWTEITQRAWLSGERQDKLKIQASDLSEIVQEHSGLLANRIFRLVQNSGVIFNIAVLLTMVVMLSVTDRAFGWQSSFVDSPEKVDQLVEIVSAPWSWFVTTASARPSYEEIVGSRIVLRESEAPLESGDLLSWWPFLMWCVLIYGLLPRMMAWTFSLWNERRLLRDLRFEGFGYRVIVERMRSIDLHTQGESAATSSSEFDRDSIEDNTADREMTALSEKQIRFYALHATLERYGPESLRLWLAEHLKHEIPEWVTLQALDSRELTALHEGRNAVVHYIVIEGWQPPIQETLNRLAEVARSLAEKQEQAVLILVGKPSAEGQGPRVLPESMQQVWNTKIRLLKCANLKILNL